MNKDWYKILGVDRNATPEEIKARYRQLAMQYHPDRNPGDKAAEAEEKFKEIKEAYEMLTDSEKRSQYEQANFKQSPFSHSTNTHWQGSDEFIDIFGDLFKGKVYSQQKKSIVHLITITLEEAYQGKNVNMDGVEIKIHAGVRSDTKFYYNDKIYKVVVLPHSKFKRSNDDLLVDVQITAFEAISGIAALLLHLDHVKLQFNIPAGIQPEQVIKLTGKGMKNPDTGKFGDLLVRCNVQIPKNLSDEQKSVLAQFNNRSIINF